jgi:hypothetical protein
MATGRTAGGAFNAENGFEATVAQIQSADGIAVGEDVRVGVAA